MEWLKFLKHNKKEIDSDAPPTADENAEQDTEGAYEPASLKEENGDTLLEALDPHSELLAAMGGGKKKKRRAIKIVAAAALVVAAGTGIFIWQSTKSNSLQAASTAAYKETTVVKGNLTVGVTETGTASINTQNVTAAYTASITEVYVKAGQQVTEGDPIVKLDTTDVDTEISKLQLEYDSARIKYNSTLLEQENAKTTAEYTYAQNQAKGTTAQETYNNTLAKLENAKTTAKSNYSAAVTQISTLTTYLQTNTIKSTDGLTGDELTNTVAKNKEIQENQEKLTSLQNSLADLQLKINEADVAYTSGSLEAGETYSKSINDYNNSQTIYNNAIAQANNTISSAKQSMDTAYDALQDAKDSMGDGIITAPCTGLVQSITAVVGDSTNPQQAIAVITDASVAYVSVSISQDDIADIAIGKAVNILFEAYEEQYTGTVDSISTTPARENASTVSYTISILVNGDVSKLYNGMTGDVTFITKEVQNILYVSNKAVYTENGVQYVKLKADDGSFVPTQVTTGFSDGQNVEISSGLAEGDTVIIESQVNPS